MSCGCGGGGAVSGGAPGVLLSGSLDGQYAGLPGAGGGPSVAADVTGATDFSAAASSAFSSGGFWVVVLFILGGAWVLDRIKRENE